MKQITFDDLYKEGEVVTENRLYRHFHHSEMLFRHDSNYIEFKQLPVLSEFEEAVEYLKEYHREKGQNHVRFVFPADEKLTADLFFDLISKDFNMGIVELYAIEPKDFPDIKENPDIVVRPFTEGDLDMYLSFQFRQDLAYGREFAEQKTEQYKRRFDQDNILQLLAYYKGEIAGSLELIIMDEMAEIDGLAVDASFQRKGIGSHLQKFVMEKYPEKVIILAADGEDSPREMYKKQNYQYIGFRHEVQKIYR